MCALDPLQRDLVKCEDMRLHAERAVAFLGTKTLVEFQVDDMLQAAVIRCVEVVGEAARQVSHDTRARAPEIPWSQVIGMRNVLAHDYGVVDSERIHAVVTRHLPLLLARLKPLLAALEADVGWREE